MTIHMLWDFISNVSTGHLHIANSFFVEKRLLIVVFREFNNYTITGSNIDS